MPSTSHREQWWENFVEVIAGVPGGPGFGSSQNPLSIQASGVTLQQFIDSSMVRHGDSHNS